MTDPHSRNLLAQILACPADDYPRAVLADWLMEQDEPALVARGELIAVQLALQEFGVKPGRPVVTGDKQADARESALRRRERELLQGGSCNWSEWFGDEPSVAVRICLNLYSGVRDAGFYSADLHLLYVRGFVARIELTTQDFLRHVAALFAAQPITDVLLSDRQPWDERPSLLHGMTSDCPWTWFPDNDVNESWSHDDPNYLPAALFACLRGRRITGSSGDVLWCEYAEEAEARADLARACVRLGRSLNDLPGMDSQPQQKE